MVGRKKVDLVLIDAILKSKKVIQKKNLISKIKFKCLKGCGAEILFDDLEKHYSTNCILKKRNYKKINKTDIKDNQKVKYFNRNK